MVEKNGQDDPSGAKIPPQSGVCHFSWYLPSKYVIHAVGPSWNDSESEVRISLLRKTVQNCLNEAHRLGDVKSIAIPAISTGAFGFPKTKCADIMIRVAFEFLQKNPDSNLKTISLTNFDSLTVNVFKKCLTEFKKSIVSGDDEDGTTTKMEESDEEKEDESKVDTNAGAIVPISEVRDAETTTVESTKEEDSDGDD